MNWRTALFLSPTYPLTPFRGWIFGVCSSSARVRAFPSWRLLWDLRKETPFWIYLSSPTGVFLLRFEISPRISGQDCSGVFWSGIGSLGYGDFCFLLRISKIWFLFYLAEMSSSSTLSQLVSIFSIWSIFAEERLLLLLQIVLLDRLLNYQLLRLCLLELGTGSRTRGVRACCFNDFSLFPGVSRSGLIWIFVSCSALPAG
jgi:hypothetical protein